MKKAMKASKTLPELRLVHKGVFYAKDKKKGWAGKRLWVAGDMTATGGRWFATWRWDKWVREPKDSPWVAKQKKRVKGIIIDMKQAMKAPKKAMKAPEKAVKGMKAMKAVRGMKAMQAITEPKKNDVVNP